MVRPGYRVIVVVFTPSVRSFWLMNQDNTPARTSGRAEAPAFRREANHLAGKEK
jgi:hypothetical protein